MYDQQNCWPGRSFFLAEGYAKKGNIVTLWTGVGLKRVYIKEKEREIYVYREKWRGGGRERRRVVVPMTQWISILGEIVSLDRSIMLILLDTPRQFYDNSNMPLSRSLLLSLFRYLPFLNSFSVLLFLYDITRLIKSKEKY